MQQHVCTRQSRDKGPTGILSKGKRASCQDTLRASTLRGVRCVCTPRSHEILGQEGGRARPVASPVEVRRVGRVDGSPRARFCCCLRVGRGIALHKHPHRKPRADGLQPRASTQAEQVSSTTRVNLGRMTYTNGTKPKHRNASGVIMLNARAVARRCIPC